MTPKEKLNKIIHDLYNGNKAVFARELGISPQTVTNWINRGISKDGLALIQKSIPSINPEWLLKGEGEMLKREKKEEAGSIKQHPIKDNHNDLKLKQKEEAEESASIKQRPIKDNYNDLKLKQKEEAEESASIKQHPIKDSYNDVNKRPKKRDRIIPLYDAETIVDYNDRGFATSEEEMVDYINPGDWFNGHETAVICNVGDAMVEYPNGCMLSVKEVKEWHLLVPGRNYVIETSEYRITRKVQRGHTPNAIMLYSTNTEKYEDGHLIHEPFEIKFEDIRRIFRVLGYVVNQSGGFRIIKS